MLRGLKQTLFAPGPRYPTETEPELCMSVSCGGAGQKWTAAGAGLWVQQTWVWHKPSWRRSPLAPPQGRQNLHWTEEIDSWRAQTKPCVFTRTQEKGAVTPQETDSDLPMSVQESPVQAWVGGDLMQDWGH